MILDQENSFRGKIARAIYHYAKGNNKYLHDYEEIKERNLGFNNIELMGFITLTSLRQI